MLIELVIEKFRIQNLYVYELGRLNLNEWRGKLHFALKYKIILENGFLNEYRFLVID